MTHINEITLHVVIFGFIINISIIKNVRIKKERNHSSSQQVKSRKQNCTMINRFNYTNKRNYKKIIALTF